MNKHQPKPNPKINDVAKLAGCSPTTVSRVLNDFPFVKADVRERVRAAAHTLGYVPNGSARALRSTRSRTVGVVIPTLKHAIYATMVDALEARLSQDGVSLIMATSSYDIRREYSQVMTLVERGCEAIVLVGAIHRRETIELLTAQNIAHVFTYTSNAGLTAAGVGFDNMKAGAIAAKFLHGYGHRAFAMVCGLTKDNDRAQERCEGFLQTLAELGIRRNDVTVMEAPYSVDAGFDAARALLSGKTRPTAIFCGSDTIAVGVVRFCNVNGIRIPDELSILGLDNLEIAQLCSPQLTTIEVPAERMGTLTGDYILASKTQRESMQLRELNLNLIVRGSTGPVAQSPAKAG